MITCTKVVHLQVAVSQVQPQITLYDMYVSIIGQALQASHITQQKPTMLNALSGGSGASAIIGWKVAWEVVTMLDILLLITKGPYILWFQTHKYFLY